MFKKETKKTNKGKRGGNVKRGLVGESEKIDLPETTTALDVANDLLKAVKKSKDPKEMNLFAFTSEGNSCRLYNHGSKHNVTKYVMCLIDEDLVDIDMIDKMIKAKKLKDLIEGTGNGIVELLKGL